MLTWGVLESKSGQKTSLHALKGLLANFQVKLMYVVPKTWYYRELCS